jgi:hypothetical protein
MKRTMQRKQPFRFGKKPVAARANLMRLIRIPSVMLTYTTVELMETRVSIQRKFRRKAS